VSEPAVPHFQDHGAAALPAVTVDNYNAELRTPDGFLGDRASSRAFKALLDHWRKRIRDSAEDDPLGDTPTQDIPRKKLDELLVSGDTEAAGLVHGVVEEFAQSLATVVKALLKLKEWRGTERIAVGGGMRGSRVGELAIGRTAMLLKGEDIGIDLMPIRHDPDEAGMIGIRPNNLYAKNIRPIILNAYAKSVGDVPKFQIRIAISSIRLRYQTICPCSRSR
jgi:hypothetical protein